MVTQSTLTDRAEHLRGLGARTLTGVVSDTGGVLRAKTVPAARIESFARSGMGASLTWPVFCVDNAVAVTEALGVVGDLRLAADLDAAVVLDQGFGWAPCDVRDQEGARSPLCWRDVTRRSVKRLAALGISALVGHEMEFTFFTEAGDVLGASGWAAYGLAPHSELSEVLTQICERLSAAGVPVEQIHAEYGQGQYELSLPPLEPLRSADAVLLARTVIGRVGREHGLRASFSPVPFEGAAGNGAHLHTSFARDGSPLLAGGPGPRGMHLEAASAIAGIVANLPGAMTVMAGTVVSGERMAPGHWSGAHACWGHENREAAVRLLAANNGNPHGANVEVKCVDAGANPYLATGIVLGLAAHGIERSLTLSPEVTGDPAALSDADKVRGGVVQLQADRALQLKDFRASGPVGDILGPELSAALEAVRTHELTAYEGQDARTLTRYLWSA
ncbi:GlnA3 [Janibacter sp. HTCC2649]|uniref:glutamine synthetase family protein n=1 Tax=Janibacter sp. HTCC2649 TaxID=313589 RepID=UPI000066EA59|nr:glutamine synthetase family protein [Janibacter sp. HTCC2649]EAP99483.1 GlnA3 [Janibacter sp. HTCC2649]